MGTRIVVLAGSLVVGDALCLGCHAVLGGKRQNDHGRHERHHVVDVAGPVELGQEGGVGDVGQALEHCKEHGGGADVERLPLAEDHNGHGQETCTGHTDLEVPGLDGRHDVGHAADGAQRTGDEHTGIAHLVDVDAHRIGCLGVLTAGPQTQAEAGLVQHDIADDEQHDAQRDKDAQLQPADAEQEGLVGIIQLGTAAVAEILGDDHRDGRRQQVQGRAADGLIRFQVDGSERQQQAVHHRQKSDRLMQPHDPGEAAEVITNRNLPHSVDWLAFELKLEQQKSGTS